MSDIALWQLVPLRAIALAKSAAIMAEGLEDVARANDYGPAVFYCQPTNNLAVMSYGDWDKSASLPVCLIDAEDADPDDMYLTVKVAWPNVSTVLGVPAHLGGWKPNAVTNVFGGPSTVTAAVGSGLLGAGLGYGAGKLLQWSRSKAEDALHKTNPYGCPYVEEDEPKFPWMSTALGAAAGAAPALWAGSHGWFNHSPVKTAYDAVCELTKDLPDVMTKSADVAYEPFIRVDKFNRTVWEDDNTPPAYRATVSGMVEGAGAVRGSPVVSPYDIGRVAVGMGSGLISGMLVGKTLGVLAGLSQSAQNDLQRAGVWAGLIKSVLS